MEIVPSRSHSVGATSPEEHAWRQAMKTAIRDPAELCRILDLPADWIDSAIRSARSFPLFVPRGYVDRMQPRNPRDPLLLQVLPLAEELVQSPGFVEDPVQDYAAILSPGLLHKYPTRVLLVTTGACAIHCRYCFRRHFPYSEAPKSMRQWEPAFQLIASDRSVREVILSGGDPLTLPDQQIAEIAERLAEIPHLRRLRIHTRLPIIIPERVTTTLLNSLRATRLTPLVVVHANHPAELNSPTAAALERLVDFGIPVLNQTVLLRGINDHVDVLVDLCERLVDLRVMPYYLHQLDRVAGAAHFEVSASRGKELVEKLRGRLPGYAVPRYVSEIPGQLSKLPVEVRRSDSNPDRPVLVP